MGNYTLVLFPEVQEYMEEEWFTKEAILYQTINEEQDYESSAYFIPTKYITSVEEKMYSKEELNKIFTDRLNHLKSEVKGVTSRKLTKRFDTHLLSELKIQIKELEWMKNKLKL